MARKSAFFPHVKRKAQTHSPGLSFYISADMLLEDEIKAIEEGNMSIEGRKLMNLNAPRKISKILPGEKLDLYQGRATKIKALRLLGRDV